MFRFNNFITLD